MGGGGPVRPPVGGPRAPASVESRPGRPSRARIDGVYATAYSIVGILLTGALVLGVGIGVGLWLAVKAVRPEALEREERTPNHGP